MVLNGHGTNETITVISAMVKAAHPIYVPIRQGIIFQIRCLKPCY